MNYGEKITLHGITLTRARDGKDGTARYVVHFLSFLSEQEREGAKEKARKANEELNGRTITASINICYEIARKRAKSLGGKPYKDKENSGGFVFKGYTSQISKSIATAIH